MNVTMLLDMAVEGFGDRMVVGRHEDGLTAAGLRDRAAAGAAAIRAADADAVIYLDVNGPAFPVALFAAARAGCSAGPGQLPTRQGTTGLPARQPSEGTGYRRTRTGGRSGAGRNSGAYPCGVAGGHRRAAPRPTATRRTTRARPWSSTPAAPRRSPRASCCAITTSSPTSWDPWSSPGRRPGKPHWSVFRRTTSPRSPTS